MGLTLAGHFLVAGGRAEPRGVEGPLVTESIARWRKAGLISAPGDGDDTGDRRRWAAIVAGVEAQWPAAPAGTGQGASGGGLESPRAALRQVQEELDGLAGGTGTGVPAGDGLGLSRRGWVALLALGWWSWSRECGAPSLEWYGGTVPERSALIRGVLACAADAARLHAELRARSLPVRHPAGPILQGLAREAAALAAAVGDAGRWLARREAGGLDRDPQGDGLLRAWAWQRLTWARARLSALQERLVYLPTREVDPILYTLLEDVFPAATPVVLAAVPSPWAFAALLREPWLAADWIDLDGDVIPVAAEDGGNPLFWPLLGRAQALARPPYVTAEGSSPAEGGDGSKGEAGDEAASDVLALAAFGPSYPLALATRCGARRPWGGARRVARRLAGLLEVAAASWGDDEHRRVSRWLEAMAHLDAPFRAPESAEMESVDWQRLWDGVGRSPLAMFGPESARVAARLVEDLAEGELISSIRGLGPEPGAPGDAGTVDSEGASSVAALYRLLNQVRDVPAASAEILDAGWRFFMGPLSDEIVGQWAQQGPGNGARLGEEAARRLEGLDLTLLRSLDVAAVHRLYSREAGSR